MKAKKNFLSLRALTAVMPLAAPLVVPLAVPLVVPVVVLCLIPSAESRENSFSGGGKVSYEFYKRNGDDSVQPARQTDETAVPVVQSNNDDNSSRAIINPILTVRSASDKNAIDLTYAPSMLYGDDDNGELQQMAKINANWSPTSRWTVDLSDSYQQTDTDLDNVNMARFSPQPAATDGNQAGNAPSQTSQTVSESQLSDQPGRERYATNLLHTEARYEYREDSFLNFGYEFEVLRYDDLIGTNQDYDKHSVFTKINHRLNSQYRLGAQARYVRGEFDEAADTRLAIDNPDSGAAGNSASSANIVDELHITTSIESLTIPHHPLSLSYSLDTSNYDDERQANKEIHTLLLGWTWEINEQSKFMLAAGPILEKTDDADDSWNYAINASYHLQWSARGQIIFNAAHGVEARNFSGNINDNGTTEYWRAGVNVSQALKENLVLNLMATAADQDVAANASPSKNELTGAMTQGSRNTRQYTLGGGLTYNFAQWYSLGLNYSYTTQNGDLLADNYDEHRVMLALSMQRDFFHW